MKTRNPFYKQVTAIQTRGGVRRIQLECGHEVFRYVAACRKPFRKSICYACKWQDQEL